MAVYAFKAHDKRINKEIQDSVEAVSEVEAIASIKKKGLLPIEVREVRARSAKGAAAKAGGGGSMFGGGVKTKEVVLFTRQLSTLQDAGLPIVQSMQILTDMQRPGTFKSALGKVTEEVQSGTMLSEAMTRYPRIWDRLYTNLVKAGESAGAIDVILRRLAEFMEKAQSLKKKIIGAMIYPIAVISIAIIIVSFIMILIVPKFKLIFEDLGVPLPGMTQALISFSSFMGSYWWLLLMLIIGTIFGLKLFGRTEKGGAILDRIKLRIPVLGMITKKGSVARFTRTLGTLVTSGVGFLDALDITKSATPNVVVRNAIQSVRDSVKEGETVHEPLRRSGVFDDIVVNMIKVGEETGELDKMLVKVADTYDEEVDAAVGAMMSLLEPMLIVFMGGAVGFIVVALFLPLIKIIETMSADKG